MKHRQISSDRRAIAPLLLIIAIVALMAVAYFALNQAQPQQRSPVKVGDFAIKPSTFKEDSEGLLSLRIENLLSTDPVSFTVYLETHQNVKVYQGSSLLPMVAGNYTLTKQLDPGEISELKFVAKGSIDVGDNSRDYYIKAYFYVGGICYDVRSVSFTITNT